MLDLLCRHGTVDYHRMMISEPKTKQAVLRPLLRCIAGAVVFSTLHAAPPDGTILSETDVWRVFRVWETPVQGTVHEHQPANGRHSQSVRPTPHPPVDWAAVGFDDSAWLRRNGPFHVCRRGTEGFGYGEPRTLSRMLLRSRFGVDNPAAAGDLELSLVFRGGAVIYLNGQEVTRLYMPEGALSDETPALDYPDAVWRTASGGGIGPIDEWADPEQHLDRVQQRIRNRRKIVVPAALLRSGVNVLAIDLRRCVLPEDLPRYAGGRDGWGTVGFINLTLVTGHPAHVKHPGETLRNVRLWNADPLDRVGLDVAAGDPFEDLHPLKLVAPRGGRASGQVVVSVPETTVDYSAAISPLRGPQGTITPQQVTVRFASRLHPPLHSAHPFYDALLPRPVTATATQPVWITVEVPPEAAPGHYAGTLAVSVLRHNYTVPVELEVADWQLPPPQEWHAMAGFWHSPFNVVHQYEVEPWSPRHLELLRPLMTMLGAAGNDVLYINAVRNTLHNRNDTILLFRQQQDGYVPDFSAVDKYLAVYAEAAAAPRGVVLYAWERGMERGRGPLPVNLRNADGSVEPGELPFFGEQGSEQTWRMVIQGLRARMDQLGWDETEIWIGVGHDARPRKATIDFFRAIAPDSRWSMFSHWRGDPPLMNGRRVLANELVIALGETPFYQSRNYGPLTGGWDYSAGDAVMLSSFRGALANAGLAGYRALADAVVAGEGRNQIAGFTRMGLDYWPIYQGLDVHGEPQYGQIWNWSGWNNLYRNNPRAIASPGPDGPVATVRYEMLREGQQEAEARIAIERVLSDPQLRAELPEALVTAANELLQERLTWRYAEIGGSWNDDPLWQKRALQLFEMAGQITAATAD